MEVDVISNQLSFFHKSEIMIDYPANMMTSIYRQIFVKSYIINDQNLTSMGCKNHVEVSHTNDVI